MKTILSVAAALAITSTAWAQEPRTVSAGPAERSSLALTLYQEDLALVRELRQLCLEELPEYVQPVGYKFISEMPFTPVGKVDYRKLEEEITPRDY
jgi:acyl-CoA synthetase (AMP-forming)/AMP-acid ligase II